MIEHYHDIRRCDSCRDMIRIDDVRETIPKPTPYFVKVVLDKSKEKEVSGYEIVRDIKDKDDVYAKVVMARKLSDHMVEVYDELAELKRQVRRLEDRQTDGYNLRAELMLAVQDPYYMTGVRDLFAEAQAFIEKGKKA